MIFDVITIFPRIFDSYKKETLIARAIKKNLVTFNIHNLRDWVEDKHKTVDGRPFGGGLGMVMKVGPVSKAVFDLKKRRKKNGKVIVFSPRGKKFNQKTAYKLLKSDHLIMVCGRYEGIDERVFKYIADEEISIGDYILMGGELASLVVFETIARLVPGVVGKPSFLDEKTRKDKKKIKGWVEYPQYTRPEIFEPGRIIERSGTKNPFKKYAGSGWKVPKVLLSGNHKEIEKWRKKNEKIIWE